MIPNVDATLFERLAAEAKRQGKSTSQLARELIERAVTEQTTAASDSSKTRRDVSRFAGTWTKETAERFDRAVASFGQIDEDLWK